jgi:cytochrome oxidase Cu insertion factor (SCO1/SenC/PrrC family)
MTDLTSTQPRASRRQLWLVVVLFFGPLAAAFLMYYGNAGWRPQGSTNKGDLIDPARPVPEAALPTPSGSTTAPDFLKGKWSIVYIGAGACDEACRKALTDMRQARLALNQNSSRVQRVFLYSGSCCDEPYFSAEQSGLITANVDDAAGKAVLDVFPAAGTLAATEAGRLYLVDPLGNLMMSYEQGAPAKGLLEDLKKLLNLSHIG